MIQEASYIDHKDKKNYSHLQVCHSGAGYYLGTIYTDPDTKFIEPGSRDSHYFETEKQAGIELELLKKGKSDLILRMTP